jgi:hypothetical protein
MPFLTTTETVGQTDEVFGFFQTEVALLQRKVSSKRPSARFQKKVLCDGERNSNLVTEMRVAVTDTVLNSFD